MGLGALYVSLARAVDITRTPNWRLPSSDVTVHSRFQCHLAALTATTYWYCISLDDRQSLVSVMEIFRFKQLDFGICTGLHLQRNEDGTVDKTQLRGATVTSTVMTQVFRLGREIRLQYRRVWKEASSAAMNHLIRACLTQLVMMVHIRLRPHCPTIHDNE